MKTTLKTIATLASLILALTFTSCEDSNDISTPVATGLTEAQERTFEIINSNSDTLVIDGVKVLFEMKDDTTGVYKALNGLLPVIGQFTELEFTIALNGNITFNNGEYIYSIVDTEDGISITDVINNNTIEFSDYVYVPEIPTDTIIPVDTTPVVNTEILQKYVGDTLGEPSINYIILFDAKTLTGTIKPLGNAGNPFTTNSVKVSTNFTINSNGEMVITYNNITTTYKISEYVDSENSSIGFTDINNNRNEILLARL